MSWELLNADWNYWPDGTSLADSWRSSAGIGFDGFEIGVYDPDVELAPERLAALRQLADETGLGVRALLYSLPPDRWRRGAFSSPVDAAVVTASALRVARIGQQEFGLGLLGLWPGADVLRRGTPYRNAWDRLVGTTRELGSELAALGVRLCLEYKPLELLGNADAALRLCDAVALENVGVLLDTGHALWAGEDLPIVVAMLGDRLFHLHLDDTPGDIDRDLPPGRHHNFVSFFEALASATFDGRMALDMYGSVAEHVVSGETASSEGYRYVRTAIGEAVTGA